MHMNLNVCTDTPNDVAHALAALMGVKMLLGKTDTAVPVKPEETTASAQKIPGISTSAPAVPAILEETAGEITTDGPKPPRRKKEAAPAPVANTPPAAVEAKADKEADEAIKLNDVRDLLMRYAAAKKLAPVQVVAYLNDTWKVKRISDLPKEQYVAIKEQLEAAMNEPDPLA